MPPIVRQRYGTVAVRQRSKWDFQKPSVQRESPGPTGRGASAPQRSAATSVMTTVKVRRMVGLISVFGDESRSKWRTCKCVTQTSAAKYDGCRWAIRTYIDVHSYQYGSHNSRPHGRQLQGRWTPPL